MEQLFSKGKSFTVFPIKVFFTQAEEQDSKVKAGVGVSSRNFKKAVQRNRIKRVLREAYRTGKIHLHDCLEKRNKQLEVFFLYVDKTMPEYSSIKEKMDEALTRLIKETSE